MIFYLYFCNLNLLRKINHDVEFTQNLYCIIKIYFIKEITII